MATKKRKARELWAVIDTTTGDVAELGDGDLATPVESTRDAATEWVDRGGWFGSDRGNRPGRYEVRKILWRFAPRGRRGK